MQTAQAIQALRHQEQTARLANGERVEAAAAQKKTVEISPYLSSIEDRLLDALLNHDLQAADLILGEALVSDPPEEVILNVITPVLNRIGMRWEKGEIGVADEHLGTNYLRQRLLMWMMSGPPPRDMNPIILACGPQEWHEGSLLVLGALLRRKRYPVAYLGQNQPLADLSTMVRQLQPPLIVLVAMTEEAAQALVNWPDMLQNAASSGKPVVGFGGRIFTTSPQWKSRIPGIYLGDSLQEGMERIEQLLHNSNR